MKDALDLLRGIESTADVTLNNIKKLEKALASGEAAIAESKKELTAARDAQLATQAVQGSVKVMMESADDALKEQIQEATATSEYSNPLFRNALMGVSDNVSNHLEIIYGGTGWSSNITVRLDMDSLAGNISDYSEAVEAAREALKVKDTRDPQKASKFWKSKVYGTGLYSKTINLRVQNMETAAPFWSLLNNGTASAEMSSNIGGTPYPRIRGTRFVQKTERVLYRLFRQEFLERRSINKNLRDNLIARISGLKEQITRVDSLITQVKQEFQNEQRAKSLANRLGVAVTAKDVQRVVAAIEQYRAQTKAGSSRVSVGGKRITVSKLSTMDF